MQVSAAGLPPKMTVASAMRTLAMTMPPVAKTALRFGVATPPKMIVASAITTPAMTTPPVPRIALVCGEGEPSAIAAVVTAAMMVAVAAVVRVGPARSVNLGSV